MPGDSDQGRIDDATLALMFMGLHDHNLVWKSFDWSTLDRLHAKGLIFNPRTKAKSVALTDDGRKEAERLFKLLFAKA